MKPEFEIIVQTKNGTLDFDFFYYTFQVFRMLEKEIGDKGLKKQAVGA